MPHNAAVPRQEATGTTQLPLSRIKKIVAVDQDIHMCSNNAAFVITIATEMFIQYMAEQGHNVVKSERKPRRNVQYRDLSSAVSHLDNLQFLSDIIPRTVPYKNIVARQRTAIQMPTHSKPPSNGEGPSTAPSHEVPRGIAVHGLVGANASRQSNGNGSGSRAMMNGFVVDPRKSRGAEEDEDPNAQLRMETQANGHGRGNGHGHEVARDGDDVEMD